MSWERELFGLLDDLEGQAGALFAAEREPEIADRAASQYREVELAGRLMASVDTDVRLDVAGPGALVGRLTRVGTGWCLLTSGETASTGQEWVVRIGAVAAVQGASMRAVPPVAWSPLAGLGLGSALRRVSDSGERCLVHRVDGTRHEGTLERVGADFVEVRESSEAADVVLVAFAMLAAVQSRA